MEFVFMLMPVFYIFGAHTWILKIHPSDIILPKNTSLEATCEINKTSSIQPGDVRFRFLIDGETNVTDVQVPSNNVQYLDNHNVLVKYYIDWPTYQNSVLLCEADSEKAKSLVIMGDFPHNITAASCYIKNWDDLICAVTTSGTNTILTTIWNYQLSEKYSGVVMVNKNTSQTDKIVIEDIFTIFSLNDTLSIQVYGINRLGKGHSSNFEVNLKDLVLPDDCHLKIEASSHNQSLLLSLSPLELDKEYLVFVEVNCSNMSSTYKVDLESERHRNGGAIIIELNENLLPASQECFAFCEVKPLHYGMRSKPSNTISFKTKDRVPLSNPDVFNSSFEVLNCTSNLECTVNIYFKSLTKEEAQGTVVQYRVTLMRNGKLLNISHHANLGLPFINIGRLQISQGDQKDFLVTIEAATIAGYNDSLEAKPLLINGSIKYYLLLFPELSNGSAYQAENKTLAPQLALEFVVLNDSHIDIIMQADGNVQNVFIVWCLFNKSSKRCRDKFGWLKVNDPRKTLDFIVPSGGILNDYMFGTHVSSGIKWIDSQCFFVAYDSRPRRPSLSGTIDSNGSHITFYLDKPQCSHDEKVNFPKEYVVEYFDVQKIKLNSKKFHFSSNPIVLDGLEPGTYQISVYALAWNKEGQSSDILEFSHTIPEQNSSMTTVLLVLLIILASLLVIGFAHVIRKHHSKKLFKIEIPSKQFEASEAFDHLVSNSNTSGYKICPEEVLELKSRNIVPAVVQTSVQFDSGKCLDASNINSGNYSSGNSYAMTKWMTHSLCLKENSCNNPSKIIQEIYAELPQTQNSTFLKNDEQPQNFDWGETPGDKNNASCDSSLIDYPQLKIIDNNDRSFTSHFQNENTLLERYSMKEIQNHNACCNGTKSRNDESHCDDFEDGSVDNSCSENSVLRNPRQARAQDLMQKIATLNFRKRLRMKRQTPILSRRTQCSMDLYSFI